MLYTDERVTELLDANTLYATGAIHYRAAALLLSGIRDDYEAALAARGEQSGQGADTVIRDLTDQLQLLTNQNVAQAAEIERLRAVPVPATQDDLARALARFDAYALRTLFEQTITLFLEYRDQHGFADEEQATQMAVSDSVSGIYAIRETDAFETEMRQAHP